MTKNDRQTMEKHNITCRSEDTYYYKTFRYQRLADAVRSAKIDAARRISAEQGLSHE